MFNLNKDDFNRVKLLPKEGVPGSDFINASFIEGFNDSKKFIAAQAPSKTTVDDFIRMICEMKIKCIVMLCKFREDTPMKAKCYPFWSDEDEIKIGGYTISSKLIDNKCSYIKRKLTIKTKNSRTPFEIDHYQYTEWPDKGAPDEAETVISIIERVNIEHSENDWPILVFCNNGIGRTGTYIILDILLETLKSTNEINIKQELNSLRMQRKNFVETWQQYKFISLTLLQRHIFGKTVVQKDFVDFKINMLNSTDKSDSKSKMEIEFEKLASFKESIMSTEIYNEFPGNFRSKIFFPCKDDHSLIELNPSSDNPIEKYFDAVSFEPSQVDIKFIIASDPTEENLADFIKLIFMRRTSIIVALSQQQYLPKMNETFTCQIYKITNIQTIESEFRVHTLEFVNTEDDNKITVHFIDDSSNWSQSGEEECEPENKELFTRALNKFLDIANDKFQHHNSPLSVLVQSKYGGDRCALFVGVCVLFNTISVANQFDIPKIVRQLRKSKPNFIYTFERYKFLYDICRKYIQMMQSSLILINQAD